jgi:hypothetical protein
MAGYYVKQLTGSAHNLPRKMRPGWLRMLSEGS